MGLCLHLPFSGCIEVNLDESVLYSILSVFELIVCCGVYFVCCRVFGLGWAVEYKSVFCRWRPFSNRNKHKSSKSCHHNTFSAKCVKRSQLDSIWVDSIQLDSIQCLVSIEYLGVYYSVFRLNDVLSVFGCAMSSISCVFGDLPNEQ